LHQVIVWYEIRCLKNSYFDRLCNVSASELASRGGMEVV
jgi:hypothetical protein